VNCTECGGEGYREYPTGARDSLSGYYDTVYGECNRCAGTGVEPVEAPVTG